MNLLSSRIIRDEALTNHDIATLCFIKMCGYTPLCHNILLSTQSIVFQMYNTINVNRGIYNKTIESISTLIELGHLKAEKLNNTSYKLDTSQFKYTKDWLPCVGYEEDDLRHIMLTQKHPVDILRYYLYLLSTVNSSTHYGYWSLDKLSEELGITTQTIIKYNKILEDMQLIYIYHSGNSNTYGYYTDKDIIEQEGRKRSNAKANHRRRVTQMYNQVKDGRVYDEKTMGELHKWCQELNQVGSSYDLDIFT